MAPALDLFDRLAIRRQVYETREPPAALDDDGGNGAHPVLDERFLVVARHGIARRARFPVAEEPRHVHAGLPDHAHQLLRLRDIDAPPEESLVEAQVEAIESFRALERHALRGLERWQRPIRVLVVGPWGEDDVVARGHGVAAPPSLLAVRALEGHGRIRLRSQRESLPLDHEVIVHFLLESPEAHGRRVAPRSEVVRVLHDAYGHGWPPEAIVPHVDTAGRAVSTAALYFRA